MQLTKGDILSFMKMWYECFDEVLTYEQAESEAKRLIDFFLTLAEKRAEQGQRLP